MANTIQESDRKQRMDDQKRNSFSDFMSDPLTRVVMSTIPAGGGCCTYAG